MDRWNKPKKWPYVIQYQTRGGVWVIELFRTEARAERKLLRLDAAGIRIGSRKVGFRG